MNLKVYQKNTLDVVKAYFQRCAFEAPGFCRKCFPAMRYRSAATTARHSS